MTVSVATAEHSGRSAWKRRPVLSTVATAVFVWGLLITTVDGFTFATTYVSRTRELMTFYLVLAIVVVALPWRTWSRLTKWMVGLFAAQVMVGLAAWSGQVEFRVALNLWSQWLLATAFLGLGLTFFTSCWWLWQKVIVGYALVIAALVLTGLLFWHTRPPVLNGPADFYGSRPIGAPAVLLMVVGLVLAATDQRLSQRWRPVIVAVLGVTVALAQHRSVWVALLIALFALAIVHRVRRDLVPDVSGLAVTAGFFLLAAVLPVVTNWSILPGNTASAVGQSLPDSFESTGTLSWRLEMWASRLSQARSLTQWLVGGMFGPTPVWGPGSLVRNPTISSHSMLVDLLSMLGLLGAVAVATLLVWATAYRWASIVSLPIVLLALVGFGFFYAWPAWAWLILGAGVAVRDNSRDP